MTFLSLNEMLRPHTLAVQHKQSSCLMLENLGMQAHINPSMPKPVAFVSMRGRHAVTIPAAVPR